MRKSAVRNFLRQRKALVKVQLRLIGDIPTEQRAALVVKVGGAEVEVIAPRKNRPVAYNAFSVHKSGRIFVNFNAARFKFVREGFRYFEGIFFVGYMRDNNFDVYAPPRGEYERRFQLIA